MAEKKKKVVILKIGGSVLTHKSRSGVYVRRKLLEGIGREIVTTLKKHPDLQLMLIHGAGSAGHQLAKKYRLADGVCGDDKKWKGSLLTRIANQELNLSITKIFTDAGLRVVPVHTGSVIVQNNKQIEIFERAVLDQAIQNHAIPLLYGEMVFDTKLGMSVCSGDVSAVHLAHMYGAEKILYASDVDGIFTKDPYKHKDAELISSVSLQDILSNRNITLSESHSVDVTGGLFNKVKKLADIGLPQTLQKVIIFSGLKRGNISKALAKDDIGTVIEV